MPKVLFCVFAVSGTVIISACSTTDLPDASAGQEVDVRTKKEIVLECAEKAGIKSSFQVTKGIYGGRSGYSVNPSNTVTDQQAANANSCIWENGASLPAV